MNDKLSSLLFSRAERESFFFIIKMKLIEGKSFERHQERIQYGLPLSGPDFGRFKRPLFCLGLH